MASTTNSLTFPQTNTTTILPTNPAQVSSITIQHLSAIKALISTIHNNRYNKCSCQGPRLFAQHEGEALEVFQLIYTGLDSVMENFKMLQDAAEKERLSITRSLAEKDGLIQTQLLELEEALEYGEELEKRESAANLKASKLENKNDQLRHELKEALGLTTYLPDVSDDDMTEFDDSDTGSLCESSPPAACLTRE